MNRKNKQTAFDVGKNGEVAMQKKPKVSSENEPAYREEDDFGAELTIAEEESKSSKRISPGVKPGSKKTSSKKSVSAGSLLELAAPQLKEVKKPRSVSLKPATEEYINQLCDALNDAHRESIAEDKMRKFSFSSTIELIVEFYMRNADM